MMRILTTNVTVTRTTFPSTLSIATELMSFQWTSYSQIYIKVMLVVTVEVPQWDQRAIILRAHSHLALGNSVTASDAKKWVEYPFLAISANANVIAKSSVWTELRLKGSTNTPFFRFHMTSILWGFNNQSLCIFSKTQVLQLHFWDVPPYLRLEKGSLHI